MNQVEEVVVTEVSFSEDQWAVIREMNRESARIGSETGVAAAQKEHERLQRKDEKALKKAVYGILSKYRRIKRNLQEDLYMEPEELRYWEMVVLKKTMSSTERSPAPESVVEDNIRRMKENYAQYTRITRAIERTREECEKSKSEEKRRRFRVLSMRFLEDDEYTIEEIALKENVGKDTIYRDTWLAVDIVTDYYL